VSKNLLKRNTEIDSLKEKILALQSKCGELYRECRDTGDFNSFEHAKLSKEIEYLEYLLWGARNKRGFYK
jgi:hypothetical protein